MAVRKASGSKWRARRQINIVFNNKADALRFDLLVDSALAEARRKFTEQITPCCTIRGKLERFLGHSEAGIGRRPCKPSTLLLHRRRLERFDEAFQRKPLDAIDPPRVERYIKKRRADGVKSDTIEAELSSLRAFARWAIGSGNAPRDVPLLSVPKLHSTGKLAGKNWRPPRARNGRSAPGDRHGARRPGGYRAFPRGDRAVWPPARRCRLPPPRRCAPAPLGRLRAAFLQRIQGRAGSLPRRARKFAPGRMAAGLPRLGTPLWADRQGRTACSLPLEPVGA